MVLQHEDYSAIDAKMLEGRLGVRLRFQFPVVDDRLIMTENAERLRQASEFILTSVKGIQGAPLPSWRQIVTDIENYTRIFNHQSLVDVKKWKAMQDENIFQLPRVGGVVK